MATLGPLFRFYVYALHGLAAEVMFTAAWRLVAHGDWKLEGHSHVWAMFIYAVPMMGMERAGPAMQRRGWTLVVRGTIYTVLTYLWEYTTGWVLRLFDACPWDYSPAFQYHHHGLVTLEYLPAWFLLAVFSERVIVKHTQSLTMATDVMTSLGSLARFYIYALHGVTTEVLFTAGWELVVNGNPKLPGNSHIWAMLIYGLSMMFIEWASPRLRRRGIPAVVRALIFTVWTYLWEFSTGWVLLQFDACPWDYAPWFDYHHMGLVTFEYIPVWFVGALLVEHVIVKYTLRLQLGSGDKQD